MAERRGGAVGQHGHRRARGLYCRRNLLRRLHFLCRREIYYAVDIFTATLASDVMVLHGYGTNLCVCFGLFWLVGWLVYFVFNFGWALTHRSEQKTRLHWIKRFTLGGRPPGTRTYFVNLES